MKKRSFVYFVITLFLTFSITIPVYALDTGPEEYIVKKGDTLWDISDSKLNDNFLWPKLWKFNPQIKNPDLIFPGDKLTIPSKEEFMKMFPELKEEAPVAKTSEAPEVKEPEVVEVIKRPKKYIVDKNMFIGSGWISEDYPSVGKVISTSDERSIVGKDDVIYIEAPENTACGDKFYVIHKAKKVKHPKTNSFIGYLITVPGVIEVTGKVDKISKAKVAMSFEEIQVGDGLLPYDELEPPTVPEVTRSPDINGYIIESYRTTLMANEGDIVFIDKGEKNGINVGDMFSVLSETFPHAPIGTIQVVELKPEVSKAVLIDTKQEVIVGNSWGKK
jgi:LysM repeat protein